MNEMVTKRIRAVLACACILLFSAPIRASDIDFSCMGYKVWGKGYVSNQFMSYDIVLRNQCPGAVYWTMCIERIDPNSFRIVETHNPSGYVEKGKTARVNLNLKKGNPPSKFRNRYQEFYVDIGYAIDGGATPSCNAARCEREKRSLRAEIKANEKAWEQAARSRAARIKNECPDSGWDSVLSEECEKKARSASKSEMQRFSDRDQDLREQMAAIDPRNCQVYSGELTNR